MKILFLDIDGVLNSSSSFEKGHCEYIRFGKDYYYQQFCPNSKKLINYLIDKYNLSIVISSTWRHDGVERLRQIWELEQMSGHILDITPCSELGFRGLEIAQWLENKGFYNINNSKEGQKQIMEKSRIEQYIIIDDDSDMTYDQRNHFIQTSFKTGFTIESFNKACSVLNKNVVQLNYEN